MNNQVDVEFLVDQAYGLGYKAGYEKGAESSAQAITELSDRIEELNRELWKKENE